MEKRLGISRREFVTGSLLASAALTASVMPSIAKPATGKANPEPLKLGIASYSLRKFTLEQTIQMTQEAAVKHLTLKDVHLPLNSSREQRAKVRRQLEEAGLVLMGGGVITMNTEQEVSAAFQYAADSGMPVVVCNPDPALLDRVEENARSSGIKVAIHNHGPEDKRWPSPLTVLEQVRKRDALMGICMDLGHTVRLRQDPVDVMKKCGKRLHDFHIKDLTVAGPDGKPIEIGRGAIDLVAVLKQLVRMRFDGHVALEHELNADNPLPGMRESFGYIRGVLKMVS